MNGRFASYAIRRLIGQAGVATYFLLLGVLLLPGLLRAQATATLTVVLRDSITRAPLPNALIEVRSEKFTKSERSIANGVAQFAGLVPHTYAISVLRIGYRSRVVTALVGGADTTVTLLLEALPTAIAKYQVRSNTQEIFGIVGAMPGPHAVVGAKVQIGAGQPTLKTDSAGKFIFKNLKPGKYTLRIAASGLSDRTQLIDLPEGTAFESSHLLDAGKSGGNARAFQWAKMQDRVRWRGFNSSLVSSEELLRFEGGLAFALSRTQEVAAKGLMRPGTNPCVSLNGRFMPGFRLDNFEIEEVAFIEVYGIGRAAARSTKALDAPACSGSVIIWTKK
ncbi:MAG: carboxypeptidase-like regulatory domain-containing protein [Gemmatimonadaceae bacterium]